MQPWVVIGEQDYQKMLSNSSEEDHQVYRTDLLVSMLSTNDFSITRSVSQFVRTIMVPTHVVFIKITIMVFGHVIKRHDQSKFTTNSMFLRNFRPGNNSPFLETEGMLANWSPSKKKSPKTVTVQEAW